MIRFIAALLSGAAGAMGLGGGSVLFIYLALAESMPQFEAQGINLIFFIPCAAVALIFHKKAGLITKGLWLPVLTGLIGAAGGIYLSSLIGEVWLRKIFAVLVLVIGAKELFGKNKNTDKSEAKEKRE